MNKFTSFLAGMAAVGAGVAAAAYYYQKKGVINVEVSYEDGSGDTVTRALDELLDAKAAEFADRAAASVSGAAKAAKTTVNEQIENIDRLLRETRETAPHRDGMAAESDDIVFGDIELV